MLSDTVKALGGVPIGLPITQVTEALSRGVVDGAFTGWSTILVFRMASILKYHYEAPLGIVPLVTVMNNKTWNGLSRRVQGSIDKHSGVVFAKQSGGGFDRVGGIMARKAKKPGAARADSSRRTTTTIRSKVTDDGRAVAMDPLVLGLIGIGGMFVLIALHVPIGVAMGLAGFVGVGMMLGWSPAIALFGIEPSGIVSHVDLAVIPLFLLMGSFAGAAGLSSDLYRLAYALVGHFRGGLAMSTIGACAGFGAVCGSSVATAATMTRVALPEMLRRDYQPSLATGCIAAGGTLGMLIPPSVIMVLYVVLTEQFVIALFVAAIVPGMIAVALHFVAIFAYVRLNPASGPAGPRMPWSETGAC